MTQKQKKLVEDIKNRLDAIDNTDPERQHVEADNLIAELLRGLGLVEIAEAYEKVDKWYA